MYALLGTSLSTFAAAYALALIDMSKVVGNGDSLVLAGLNALHAADAACLASLHSLSALLLVVAHYKQLVVSGDNLDNIVGAGLSTKTTTYTTAAVYSGDAVFHANSIRDTNCRTVATAYTTKATSLRAAEKGAAGMAGFHTVVDRFVTANGAVTVAMHHCYYVFGFFYFNTENFAQLFCHSQSAGNAEVGCRFAFGNGFGIVVTTFISASATVGTGEGCTDFFDFFVFRYGEEVATNSQ